MLQKLRGDFFAEAIIFEIGFHFELNASLVLVTLPLPKSPSIPPQSQPDLGPLPAGDTK
jgi:hypothetical protein